MQAAALVLLYCPFPDIHTARTAARTLIEQQLVACCNLLPANESHYVWEGRYTIASEIVLLAKTTAEMLPEARSALVRLHPHECPAILGFEASTTPEFAVWVAAGTAGLNKVHKQD